MLPLLFSQESIISSTLVRELVTCAEVIGPIDVERLRRSYATVLERHEALRTRIIATETEYLQDVSPRPHPLEVVAIDEPDVDTAREKAHALIAERARIGLDWHDRCLSSTLIKISDTEYLLCSTVSHLVSDAQSLGIFWRDWDQLYSNPHTSLPPLPLRYSEYVRDITMDIESTDRALRYWGHLLHGAPKYLELSPDIPYSDTLSPSVERDTALAKLTIASSTLQKRSIDLRTTPFGSLLAAWLSVLSKAAANEDVMVRVFFDGRRPEDREMIGLFSTMLPFRARVQATAAYEDLIPVVTGRLFEPYRQGYRWIPHTQILARLGIADRSRRTRTFAFNYIKGARTRDQLLFGCRASFFAAPVSDPAVPENRITIVEEGETTQMLIEFHQALYSSELVLKLADRVKSMVETTS